jgi:hypothetical protein
MYRGRALENVSAFKYLGRGLSDENKDIAAASSRIAVATGTTRRLLPLLQKGSANLKLKVWNTVVKAQVSYGGSTWVMSKDMRRKLDCFQLRWLRRISDMQPKFDAAANAVRYPKTLDVMKATGAIRLSDMIDQRRLLYAGHVLRRGPLDPVRKTLDSEFPLRGREGVTKGEYLRTQVTALMREADLETGACFDRQLWRQKCAKFVASRKTNFLRALEAGLAQGQPEEPVPTGENVP